MKEISVLLFFLLPYGVILAPPPPRHTVLVFQHCEDMDRKFANFVHMSANCITLGSLNVLLNVIRICISNLINYVHGGT